MRTLIAAISIWTSITFADGIKQFPSFNLPDLNGQNHLQTEYQGKVVLIDFWATWCSTCQASIPKINALKAKYASKGLVVIGISTDDGNDKRNNFEKLKKFTVNHKMDYSQILWDKENLLSKSLDFNGVPTLFLFDTNGQLVKALKGLNAASEAEAQRLDVELEAAIAKLLP